MFEKSIHILVVLLCVTWQPSCQVHAFKRKYKDVYTLPLQGEKEPSQKVDKENALKFCPCDVTANSCDAYCCCDYNDCAKEVITFWTENYADICEKNTIQNQYKSK